MTVKLALLGAGRIGQVHAHAISGIREATLVAVADPLETAASAVAHKYNCQVASIDEIAGMEGLNGVLICTPTNTHADLIERFARLGKAVFCEKPVDLDLQRVKTCLEVVREAGTPLMLGFNRRFDPHFAAVRKAVVDGRVGTVEQVSITSRDPGLPPFEYIDVSGGIFRDMTIHDFDIARFLLGEEVASVQATASVLVDPRVAEHDDFDTVTVVMTTADGKQCTIQNSRRAAYGYDQRLEVFGSTGMLTAENQRPVSIELANSDGFTRPQLHDFFMTRYMDAYAAEIRAFVDTILEGTIASPSGEDGLLALALAEAAIKSAKEGRKVQMSEIH
ncbi:inositol 2-dehydrogenase [Roseibium sp. SCP14]|uniref:inositol 2-dehydrogenase n=1 Tax=Roseibium sp. SCP14 TaxID=3141375 RepID=UPI0033353BE4